MPNARAVTRGFRFATYLIDAKTPNEVRARLAAHAPTRVQQWQAVARAIPCWDAALVDLVQSHRKTATALLENVALPRALAQRAMVRMIDGTFPIDMEVADALQRAAHRDAIWPNDPIVPALVVLARTELPPDQINLGRLLGAGLLYAVPTLPTALRVELAGIAATVNRNLAAQYCRTAPLPDFVATFSAVRDVCPAAAAHALVLATPVQLAWLTPAQLQPLLEFRGTDSAPVRAAAVLALHGVGTDVLAASPCPVP
jgi:hypothetical protein